MGAFEKIKEWLFGTNERKEEKQIAMKPEEHLHPHEHQVTIYEEKPPALLHLQKKKPVEDKPPKAKKKISAHRKIKELKTMAKKKTTKKKVKGKKKKR